MVAFGRGIKQSVWLTGDYSMMIEVICLPKPSMTIQSIDLTSDIEEVYHNEHPEVMADLPSDQLLLLVKVVIGKV